MKHSKKFYITSCFRSGMYIYNLMKFLGMLKELIDIFLLVKLNYYFKKTFSKNVKYIT